MVIITPTYTLSTGSGSLNASNSWLQLLLSLTYNKVVTTISNLHTFITSSPFNVLAVLALYPSLPSSSSLKLLIAPSVMLHLVSGISSLCLFVNLILVPVLPFLTDLFFHPSLLLFWFTILFHSCLKTYLFHKSYPVVSLLPPGLPPRTIAWTVPSYLLGFCFYFFPLFFVSGPCARLSWPSCQLLSAR